MKMTIDELNEIKKRTTDASTEETEEVVLKNERQDDSLEYASLSFWEKRKYRLRQYAENSKDMEPIAKIKYTLFFYKYPIIAIFIISFLLAAGGNILYRATLPDLVKVAIVNQKYDNEEVDKYILKSMREYLGAGERNIVSVHKNYFVAADEDPEMKGVTMTDYMNLGHFALNDNLDVYIVDEDALKTYTWSEDTTAIDLSMDNELYEKVKDHVVYLTDTSDFKKNDGKPYAGALEITDTEFVKNAGIEYSPVYLLIPSTKWTNNERTLNFIKMVYGIK